VKHRIIGQYQLKHFIPQYTSQNTECRHKKSLGAFKTVGGEYFGLCQQSKKPCSYA